MSYRNDVLVLLKPLEKEQRQKGNNEELKNITKNTKRENSSTIGKNEENKCQLPQCDL